jgi:hypothetical protein
MPTISQTIENQVGLLRKKRSPRRKIIAWMRRNTSWFQEAIALEWERQTGEDWYGLMRDAHHGA